MPKHKNYSEYLMSEHNILTSSEDQYLVTIRQISEEGDNQVIPIPKIAAALDVQPVSVNHMVKKLADTGYVNYIPYKGVELTAEGRAISNTILRHRRMWEVFLVKALKMGIEEADVLACQLEHITSEDVANRLSIFLEDPAVCYHGKPIYPSRNQAERTPSVALSAIKVGRPFQVVRVDGDESAQSFLRDVGVFSGSRGSILAADGSGKFLLETNLGESVTVTKDIANTIFVEEQNV
jgi:DtxR family transcriptional regulator, Mn-dependent transcriptional regulator